MVCCEPAPQRETRIVEGEDRDRFESLNRAPTVSARFIFESSRFINQMITTSIYSDWEGLEGSRLKRLRRRTNPRQRITNNREIAKSIDRIDITE